MVLEIKVTSGILPFQLTMYFSDLFPKKAKILAFFEIIT
ncbi:hypothetical protein GGD38_007076 [Chitinophagaceae bacterium OAS944]|nr:hypothetical protein [Chitinophagaceae bacterium OAS944]